MKSLFFFLLAAAGLVATNPVQAGEILSNPQTGDVTISRIDVIQFAPEGILLIGNGQARHILAVQTDDVEPVSGDFGEMPDFVKTMAAKIGVGEDDVELIDMEVNPASGRLYVAIRNQKTKQYGIITVSPDGSMEPLGLTGVSYVEIPLPEGEEAPVNRITDIVWIDNRIVAAARCTEEFASKIFSADAPLRHGDAGSLYSAETYHVSHRKWETKAPMSVMIPFEENGKHYIVGAFSCTPVVKYPIDAIQPGAKIKGVSMIELGSGNRPLDMFSYHADGGEKVLTNTYRFHHEKRPYGPSPHLAFRFDEDLLGGAESVNENATRRLDGQDPATDKISIAEPFHGVVYMSRLNDKSALALRESGELVAIHLP